MPSFILSAAVTLVGVAAVLVLVLILIAVLVILVLVLIILILVLIVHDMLPLFIISGRAVLVACPENQLLSFGLKIKLAKSPAKTAAVIPPAADFSPPVNIPRNPSCSTASFTPLAKL